MEVNSAVWGAPETWETYDASPITIQIFEGKLPVFDSSKVQTNIDRYDVKSALAAGKLSTAEPIDVSVCPWRIRGDSYFLGDLHRVAFLPGSGGARYTFKTEPLYDEYARNMGAPVALTWGDAPAIPPKMLHYGYIWGDSFDPTGPLYAGDWSPLCDFNYRKICVVPYVVAYDSNRYETVNIPLSTYVANGGVNRYRYLQGLRPMFYVGGAGAWVGVGKFSMRLFGAKVDGFEVTGRDEYAEPFLTYGDGVRERVTGATQLNGYTDFSGSDEQATEAASYAAQLTNNSTIFYRSIPEGWYMTDRGAGTCITEYDNFNEDFTVDWIIEQFLTLGLWVYTGADIADFDPAEPDEYAYAPLFDEYGTTTGQGVNGAAAAQTAAGGWTNNVQGEDVYRGEEPPYDPTHYDPDNKTTLRKPIFTSGNKLYAITVGELQGIIGVVNSTAASASSELDVVQKFLTNNPIDVIKGVVFYPFNVKEHIDTEATQTEIVLGNVNSGVNGYKVEQRVCTYDAGSVTYYPPNGLNDFRSYEPYSSAELYIPYCGSVKIQPSDYIGHKVGVKYLIDVQSGGCVALVYRDDLAIDSIAGQIGVSCPITGVQTATLQAAQEQAQRASINSKVNMFTTSFNAGMNLASAQNVPAIASAAVNGAAQVSGAYLEMKGAQYALEHMQIPYKNVGAAGAATSTANEQCCRLVIHRPVLLEGADIDAFGSINGFACCITAQLSTFSGFTQVSTAELDGVGCTAAERAALISALQTGVFL